MTKNNTWTREETIIAFNIYCKIPFKSSSKNNPIIIKYAKIIGRSPSSLNMKVGNFGRLDPELKKQGIVGLTHGSKLEEKIWEEFHGNWESLAYESELLVSKYANKPVEEIVKIDTVDIEIPIGRERETIIKQRVNQSFFRSTILAAYNHRCCITGLNIPNFLVASHIIPWSKNEKERLNPNNGLCLNSLHDKAFDKGFLTITPDYKIKLSKKLEGYKNERWTKELFINFENKQILLPNKFYPNKEFLDYHYKNIFIK